MSAREAALQQALQFVTSMQWGTVPYMETQVYFDAVQLRDVIRTALAEPHHAQGEAITREEVIKLAREVWSEGDTSIGPKFAWLELFAAFVAAAEREACARVCEGRVKDYTAETHFYAQEHVAEAQACAAAIRARGAP